MLIGVLTVSIIGGFRLASRLERSFLNGEGYPLGSDSTASWDDCLSDELSADTLRREHDGGG